MFFFSFSVSKQFRMANVSYSQLSLSIRYCSLVINFTGELMTSNILNANCKFVSPSLAEHDMPCLSKKSVDPGQLASEEAN